MLAGMPSLLSPPQNASGWVVACLCAQWCRTCGDYAEPFAAVTKRFPDDAFVWIDIEDDSDWVDDIDVENFPTLLVAFNGEPRFFGTVQPHPQQLVRLLASVQATEVAMGAVPAAVLPLARRLSVAMA